MMLLLMFFIGCTKNDIVVSKAGKLPARFIIHLTAEDYPALSTWKALVKKALMRADRTYMKTIVFPALGTGENSLITQKGYNRTCLLLLLFKTTTTIRYN